VLHDSRLAPEATGTNFTSALLIIPPTDILILHVILSVTAVSTRSICGVNFFPVTTVTRIPIRVIAVATIPIASVTSTLVTVVTANSITAVPVAAVLVVYGVSYCAEHSQKQKKDQDDGNYPRKQRFITRIVPS
jgi:hypothetical protein